VDFCGRPEVMALSVSEFSEQAPNIGGMDVQKRRMGSVWCVYSADADHHK